MAAARELPPISCAEVRLFISVQEYPEFRCMSLSVPFCHSAIATKSHLEIVVFE